MLDHGTGRETLTPFSVFDSEGRPAWTGTCQVEALDYCVRDVPGHRVVAQPCDLERDYLTAQGQVAPRPTLPATLTGNVLHGVPAGARVTIEDATYTADGSPIELEFALPGRYRLHITHFPYLPWEASYETPA